MEQLIPFWWIIALILFVFSGLVTVNQGYINVITMFGKYRRIMLPGLNFKIPLLETVAKRISIQNRSVELEFQAVTADQANVYFKSMLLYAVQNAEEETIKKVAFKFISDKELMQALTRTIEGSIRAFVATKKQAEILGLRKEIVEFVKDQIDHSLEEWGYHLLDLQINDITFDQAIIDSMSKVVASNNLKAAAENEGQALLITKTVGSMNCAYAFAVLALLSLPAVLSQFGTFAHTFPAWMIKASVISLIAWIAQTFLQLVLLSVIMVGQSVQSAAADVRASKTFEDTEKIVDALRIDTEGGLGIIYTRIGELEHAVIGVRRLLGDQPNDYKAPTSVTVSSVRNEKTRKHPKPKETS
jgi:hypothetical protein